MPRLGLARDQPLSQGFAANRNIRAGVKEAIVAHEEPEFLRQCQYFTEY